MTARQTEGGQGTQREQTAGRARCAHLFLNFFYLLTTHYSSPTCRTQKTRHTVAFFVFGGSPAPALVPSSPSRKCAHVGMFFVLGCFPPPPPALSPPPGHEKHARHACFSCSAAPLPLPSSPCSPTQGMCPCGHVLCARLPPHPYLPPPPPPGHEKHAHVACFSCSAALIPQPLSLTRKLCPCGHDFRARTLLLQPNTKNVPMWACSFCSAASLSPHLPPHHPHDTKNT